MKAPFGRFGGKSKIAKILINKFPNLKLFNHYVEPFVGAGNVFFRKPYIEEQIEVINDLDKDIYDVMEALKTNNKYINENINRAIDREYFNSIKNKNDVLTTLEKIKSSFFSKKTSFSNPRNGGKYTQIKTDFRPYEERLKKTIILNEPFEKVIEKYDGPFTFFYLDPPYESKTQKDYNDYVTPEKVYNVLSKIKGKFMLSYNDSEKIRTLFEQFKITEINTCYEHTQFVSKRQKNELIITNY